MSKVGVEGSKVRGGDVRKTITNIADGCTELT